MNTLIAIDDCVDAICFLLSESSSSLNGQSLAIDGGLSVV